jgi:hypothetical protein
MKKNRRKPSFNAVSGRFPADNGKRVNLMVKPQPTIFLWICLAVAVISACAFTNVAPNDPRVPDEVRYKAGYVNPLGRPADFHSVMLWGIAIADARVAGYESARVEIASVELSCRIDSQNDGRNKDPVLIRDVGLIHGGLYQRIPWFSGNQPEPIPMQTDASSQTVILPVGQRADRIWHFWSASPRPALPAGKIDGCTVKVRAKISRGALLQIGMDYWRDPTVPFGHGGNNHEAGASDWYFPSDQWQEAVFSDIRRLDVP